MILGTCVTTNVHTVPSPRLSHQCGRELTDPGAGLRAKTTPCRRLIAAFLLSCAPGNYARPLLLPVRGFSITSLPARPRPRESIILCIPRYQYDPLQIVEVSSTCCVLSISCSLFYVTLQTLPLMGSPDPRTPFNGTPILSGPTRSGPRHLQISSPTH